MTNQYLAGLKYWGYMAGASAYALLAVAAMFVGAVVLVLWLAILSLSRSQSFVLIVGVCAAAWWLTR